MNPETFDANVLRDARLMLQKASRIIESLERSYFASESDEIRFNKGMSEAIANVHAALARIAN